MIFGLELKKKEKSEELEEDDDADDSQDIEDLPTINKTLTHLESFHYFADQEKQDLRTKMLSWYSASCRTLPWRAAPGSESNEDRFRNLHILH